MNPNDVDDAPSYGASDHYLGEQGETYAHLLRRNVDIKAKLNARTFSPYVQRTDTVIDFGCGNGGVLSVLDCAKRIGVEINPAARKDAATRGVSCVATLAEVEDGIADVVISNHALEHVPQPITALTQMREKLKPNGKLVLSLPVDDWRRQKRYDPADINHHLCTWTPLLLGHTLHEAGFDVRPSDIQLVHRAWPKYYPALYKRLPEPVFDALCRAWTVVTGRRNLLAVVCNRSND